jgi:hypothetical protein
MRDWDLTRRELLRSLGAGAAVLPLLHAGRALAGPAPAPRRLFIVASSQGYRFQTGKFNPTPGSLLTQLLPDTLSPLQFGYPALPASGTTPALPAIPAVDLRSNLLVLLNLTNPAFASAGDPVGMHAYGTEYFGGAQMPSAGGYMVPAAGPGHAGYTVDQVVGEFAQSTSHGMFANTLPLQVQVTTYLADGGTGAHYCFWGGAGMPVQPYIDPYAVYMLLFGGSSSGQDRLRILAARKSVLDFIGKDLERFGRRLGTGDAERIQLHLQSIRDIEVLLSQQIIGATKGPLPADFAADQAGMSASPPWALDNANYPAVMNLQFKLGVAALAAGLTRVVTLQVLSATGDAHGFGFVPLVPGAGMPQTMRNGFDLHAFAHAPVRGGVEVKQLIDKWFMGQFASLLQQMKNVQEGASTLLDNSIVLWGNCVQSGDSGRADVVPWLIGGSGGGYLKNGVCIDPQAAINGVLAEICLAFGVPGYGSSVWTGTTFGEAAVGQPIPAIRA